ncbi:MAG: trypsin-like serine protease [Pseudonocardiaceae bacterium]|nr:trypsin-like serine protease [Pseudonocardiaceae bacterium]
MNRRGMARAAGASIFTAAIAAALTVPGAAAAPTGQGASASPSVASADMLAAMQRDLDLTAKQAKARVAQETEAAQLERSLSRSLGESYGGAVFDTSSGKLVVHVTDAARAGSVRAAGAEAKVVEHSVAELDAVSTALNEHAKTAPNAVSGWYTKESLNSVVLTVQPGSAEAAKAFVTASGADPSAVRIVESAERPRLFQEQIVGGNAYTTGSSRCSIGFSVNGGFVTAGHCGDEGTSTSNPTGTVAGSVFPGNDYAWVESSAQTTPTVNDYSGGTVTVAGSTEASEGASICRSGSTTGWHCGTVQAKGQTVSYPEGTVNGLTRTDVCAEPGDSGGSFISGNQAQGMTSGGSGDCSSGGTTYFQPVNPALNAFGLSLVTG